MRFDDSLPTFTSILVSALGKEQVEAGFVLRDASGYLSFISDVIFHEEAKSITEQELLKQLQAYCREDRILLFKEQAGVSWVLKQARQSNVKILLSNNQQIKIKLLENRIVGQDWLTEPAPSWNPPSPARFVFASLKGGVGRSTALAVVATEWARRGRKVLVVDLDLEAPGIGSILLQEEELPKFGVLDWLVEQKLSGTDEEFLTDMTAASAFGGGKGLIDVVPATGKASVQHPGNVTGKIARAYLESHNEAGEPLSFLKQTQLLIDSLSKLKHYDTILIDARAGLNETTAAAILGLGADVLLFGEDTPQTFSSYRYLLAHLARFPRNEEDDWLYRLHMIHAKASADAGRQQAFRDNAHKIFQELLYQEKTQFNEELPQQEDEIILPEFSLDDEDAPHFAWPVLHDSNYLQFDPLADASILTLALYERTYAALFSGMNKYLSNDTEASA